MLARCATIERMRIAGLQKLTLLDYPGKTACTVFTPGCDFRCPFCHNADVVVGVGAVPPRRRRVPSRFLSRAPERTAARRPFRRIPPKEAPILQTAPSKARTRPSSPPSPKRSSSPSWENATGFWTACA